VEALALERTLTELDHVRLSNLLRRDRRGDRASMPPIEIEDLLDGCAVVTSRQVRPDVVTMYSQVLLQDIDTGLRSKLTLCYPADAEPAAGFVSVLSPVGSSLLGLPIGAVARWRTPAGDERGAQIIGIPFQPEASGDYTR